MLILKGFPSQPTPAKVTVASGSGKNEYVPAERSTLITDVGGAKAAVDPVIVAVACPTALPGGQGPTPLSLTETVVTAYALSHSAFVQDNAPPEAFTVALTDSLTVQLRPPPVAVPLTDKLY